MKKFLGLLSGFFESLQGAGSGEDAAERKPNRPNLSNGHVFDSFLPTAMIDSTGETMGVNAPKK
jgi:hypothetical protein